MLQHCLASFFFLRQHQNLIRLTCPLCVLISDLSCVPFLHELQSVSDTECLVSMSVSVSVNYECDWQSGMHVVFATPQNPGDK